MTKQITKAENIAYLEKGLYYNGFGIEANKVLKEQIAKQVNEFSIPVQMLVAGKQTDFRLDFKQSEKQPDIYFFNGYQATLKENPERAQYFAITKNNGITTREAVNLLEGRAVAKSIRLEDGSRQEIWTQINFQNKKDNGNYERKTYFPSYGFDMDKALNSLPLKIEEGKQQLPKWIASSIKKGNAVAVNMEIDGKVQKNTIVANPQFKTIDVFDKNNSRILQANGNSITNKEQVAKSPSEQIAKDSKATVKETSTIQRNPRKSKIEKDESPTSRAMRR
ncbi:hypothetical protein [Rhizosphaericola mali]|uniref:DUF3945 domain-containing protein n=1 Tax=Rhizosphaericola mali TaxID=2545455 RepID=A0A5P2GBJ1_9BACT|nr:hypothetical protein [Rhizosphaericola mali]QES88931.1 hypothetical protein E0W69_009765 [Rhizosphaericola mali]